MLEIQKKPALGSLAREEISKILSQGSASQVAAAGLSAVPANSGNARRPFTPTEALGGLLSLFIAAAGLVFPLGGGALFQTGYMSALLCLGLAGVAYRSPWKAIAYMGILGSRRPGGPPCWWPGREPRQPS